MRKSEAHIFSMVRPLFLSTAQAYGDLLYGNYTVVDAIIMTKDKTIPSDKSI
jgi:hypothetical protein